MFSFSLTSIKNSIHIRFRFWELHNSNTTTFCKFWSPSLKKFRFWKKNKTVTYFDPPKPKQLKIINWISKLSVKGAVSLSKHIVMEMKNAGLFLGRSPWPLTQALPEDSYLKLLNSSWLFAPLCAQYSKLIDTQSPGKAEHCSYVMLWFYQCYRYGNAILIILRGEKYPNAYLTYFTYDRCVTGGTKPPIPLFSF